MICANNILIKVQIRLLIWRLTQIVFEIFLIAEFLWLRLSTLIWQNWLKLNNHVLTEKMNIKFILVKEKRSYYYSLFTERDVKWETVCSIKDKGLKCILAKKEKELHAEKKGESSAALRTFSLFSLEIWENHKKALHVSPNYSAARRISSDENKNTKIPQTRASSSYEFAVSEWQHDEHAWEMFGEFCLPLSASYDNMREIVQAAKWNNLLSITKTYRVSCTNLHDRYNLKASCSPFSDHNSN